MAPRRDPWLWAGVAGAAAAAGAAGAAGALHHRLKRQIESDPEREALSSPPRGTPLSITSADGTSLHAEVFGADHEGPTVVLAHGWTEELGYWIYVIRELVSRGLRLVAFDLRGHGHSGRALSGDYAIARFGEDLEAVLEACVPAGQRAVIAGHSLGAMSIAAWAEHHQVERLVGAAALLNTGVGNLLTEQLLLPVPKIARAINEVIARRGFMGARAALPRFSTPVSHAAIRYAAFGTDATPAQVAFYERMLLTFPPDVRADVGIAISELDLYEALPRLTVPTLVMAGDDDRLTPPSHARRIAEALPNLVRLEILPDTGHMGPLERPMQVSDALAELVALVRGAAPAPAGARA